MQMEQMKINSIFQFSTREYYLMRKFGHKWLRATFGKVSPTRARFYFYLHLLRKSFLAWQDQSCHTCSWILLVRADCNNKYRIMTRHWNSWRRYIQSCRDKKKLLARADHLNFLSYAKIFFPAWKEFVLVRRARKQEVDTAIEFNLMHLLVQCFQIWREELHATREYRSLESNALSLWCSSIQRRSWFLWLRRVQEKYEQKQLLATAGMRYNNKLTQLCYDRLKVYMLTGREKKSINGRVRRDYERRVLMRFLVRWRVRRWKEKNVRDKQRQIESLALQSGMRRKWLTWLRYTSKCREEREREAVGRKFRIRALKSRGWNAILSAHKSRRVLEWKSEVALQLWVLWRYRHAWNSWEERMEVRIEVKQEPVSRIARQHYYKVVAARAFVALQTYRLERKSKKERYKIGEDSYSRALKMKSFSALKRYVHKQRMEREHSSLSSMLRREIFLNHFFYVWVAKLEQQRETNELIERAEYHHAGVLLRSIFSEWKERYVEANRERMRILTAVISYNMALQRKYIVAWKIFVLSCEQRRKSKVCARREYQIRVMKKCFVRMKLMHARNEFIRKRCQRLVSALDMSSVRKTFKAWNKFISIVREERGVELMAENHWRAHLQKQVFREWCDNIAFLKTQKEMGEIAGIFWNKCLIVRYFHIWKSTKLFMAEQGKQETEVAGKVSAVIHRGCLYRCFWGWLILKDKAVIKRYNRMKADSFYSHSLTKRSLAQWTLTLKLRRQLRLGYVHAIWYHRSCLMARTYTQWRLQLNQQLYRNHRRTLALWNWSHALQMRVFFALRTNALECRRRKLRCERAAELFRDRVVSKGILQILHTGNAMLAAEETSVLRNIERHTKYSWGCALRCARVWRQKTQARRAKKPGVIRYGLADLDGNFQKQFSNLLSGELGNFWSEITDLTIRTRNLPPPRIPEYLKHKCNPLTSNIDEELSSDSVAPIHDQAPTCAQDVEPVSTVPGPTDDVKLNITQSDMELLRETKEQLMQVLDSKLLLKSVREGQVQPSQGGEVSTEGLYDVRNRVHEIEEQIHRSEVSIKLNIGKLTQHFKIPAKFEK